MVKETGLMYLVVLQISFEEIQVVLKGVFMVKETGLMYLVVLQISFEEIQVVLKGVFMVKETGLMYLVVLQISFEEIQVVLKGVFSVKEMGLMYLVVLQISFEEIQVVLKGVFICLLVSPWVSQLRIQELVEALVMRVKGTQQSTPRIGRHLPQGRPLLPSRRRKHKGPRVPHPSGLEERQDLIQWLFLLAEWLNSKRLC